ncbi:putative calcium-transporting ATPase 13, plasma membrane-type isoform X2 [Andrographis paniculata]|uniref:putative calcium-transporting ATPase 13, plasma membrane-type isoform X2 n=1 Tax=Andrographis paniculata TaxID=175694 RepID=UPI0021E91BE5|nr:putative calcium-transporting ATPase 13, plasma membrane-type isoform X2 [Andrographis paniculata]
MASIVGAKVECMDRLLLIDDAITASNRRRWRMAFVVIYCSRAFDLSRFRRAATPKLTTSSEKVVIEVSEKHPLFSSIDRLSLSNLVKGKSARHLARLGGVKGISVSLKTDRWHGINDDDDPKNVAARREAFGSNSYKKPAAKSFVGFVWEAFKDPTIVVLLACAALSLGFGIKQHGPTEGWYDGGSIFIAVFLVVSVSSVSNFRQSRQFEKLSKVSGDISVEVVRSGRRQKISIFDVVVGDVVCLKIGDQVPADGLFVDGYSLQVDESSMTGESDHVEVEYKANPFLFSGTKIVDGYGKMLVTSVGMNTTWGEMMSTISRDSDEETPLQSRLNGLTSSIGKVGLAIAFAVLVVLLVRYFTGNTKNERGDTEFVGGRTNANDIVDAVVRIVAAAVTIVVVAIPEGLPLAVTLTLAYSMKRMMADQAMVRKLSACETMGSATTICTDKTGTLTTNQMKVTKFWQGKEDRTTIAGEVVELLRQGVGLNTMGGVYESGAGFEFSGSPTEKAILSWAVLELKMDIDAVQKNYAILNVETFNSEKKRSGVLTRKIDDDSRHVHWKGAAEMILAMCSSYYDSDGKMKLLDSDEMVRFNRIIEGMAAGSLRCIGFAHSRISEIAEEDITIRDDGLTLLGLVGLKDPCRPGAKKAVEDCQHAGVNVKMITGDNIFTAKAIATECGILSCNQEATDGSVIEGLEFRNYSDEERMARVDKICVMARSSPFDKLLIVECLKKKGHVVAVTGDGTNDAPALKEADIGLSMGIQGTEVAKESSDIVILDDNFATVATVLRWGRCVYDNIQKFVQFQLTVNVAALAINFVAAISAGEVPLTAVQLLWLNLIMDTLGALALATERPTRELMEKNPVGRSKPLITNVMWRNLTAQAFYQISILLTLQFGGESIFGVTEKNIFEGVLGNKAFVGIVAATVALQVVMVEVLKKFADTERLSLGEWGICVGIAAVTWPVGWAVKFVPVPETPLLSYFSLKKLRRDGR